MPDSTAVAGEATRADLDLSRLARAAGWVAFSLAFGFEALAILRANQTWLVHRLPDDAYYYLEVGVRIAHGHGATFDGLHRTNGFHPLSEATIALLAVVFHGQALVRAVLLTELAMGAAALSVCYRLLARVWGARSRCSRSLSRRMGWPQWPCCPTVWRAARSCLRSRCWRGR